MWLPINGLSCLASVNAARLTDGQGGLGASAMVFRHPLRPWVMPVNRYFRLPASQEGCWALTQCCWGLAMAAPTRGTIMVVCVIGEFGWPSIGIDAIMLNQDNKW